MEFFGVFKGTVMQIEKALIKDRLCVQKFSESFTFRLFPTIYPKTSVFFICVEAIIFFLLHNLHDYTFNINYRNHV